MVFRGLAVICYAVKMTLCSNIEPVVVRNRCGDNALVFTHAVLADKLHAFFADLCNQHGPVVAGAAPSLCSRRMLALPASL